MPTLYSPRCICVLPSPTSQPLRARSFAATDWATDARSLAVPGWACGTAPQEMRALIVDLRRDLLDDRRKLMEGRKAIDDATVTTFPQGDY